MENSLKKWVKPMKHKTPLYEDFAKGVLAQEKILAVTDSRRDTPPLQPFQQPTNGMTVDTSMYDALKIDS